MKKFVVAVLILGLAGCAGNFEKPTDAFVYDPLPYNYKDMIRENMEGVLFDYDSSKFKFGTPSRGYANKGVLLGGGVSWTGYVVSVSINAKNRFGAYVGWSPYTFYFDDGAIYRRYEGGLHTLVTQQAGAIEYTDAPPGNGSSSEDTKVSEKGATFGEYQYNAEKLASSHGCDAVILLTQNPPVEIFQTSCSGSKYLVRCEWDQCAVIN